MSQRPVIAVIGTTGVGKSQLAVSLAQSLRDIRHTHAPSNATVLSADSMQLYKGLDVITNKVTVEEQGGIEHWGLDVVSPGEGGSWEVGRWCNEASKKVESMPFESLPIICGGTHYFIQHFLFPPEEMSFSRPPTPDLDAGTPFDPLENRWKPSRPLPPLPAALAPELESLLNTFWTATPTWPAMPDGTQVEDQPGPSRSRPTLIDEHQLYSIYSVLQAVDPKEAGRWHWRDGRKVRRGLERWWDRGGTLDDVSEGGPTQPGRQARFRTLIFWVYEPLETLRPRLDKRVDRMLEVGSSLMNPRSSADDPQNGLLREIAEMRETALGMYGSSDAIDHTEGIFQAIGYKEFAQLPLPQDDPSADTKFPSMLAQTKSRTYQYARSQLKWIRKQLLPAVREARSLGGTVEVYAVPGGQSGEGPSRDILERFLASQPLPSWRDVGHGEAHALLEEVYSDRGPVKVPDTAERQVLNARKDCPVCSSPGKPFSLLESEWDTHLRSRVHRRHVRRQDNTKDKEIDAQIAARDAKRAEREAARAARASAAETISE